MTNVLITGVGLCSSLGKDSSTNWRRLCASEPACEHQPGHGLEAARMLAMSAADEALRDAGNPMIDPERFGCTLSASKPIFGADDTIFPPEVIGSEIRAHFGLRGEYRNVVAACATGAYAIALAASWIEQGLCDAVLAGSVEPYPHALMRAGFERMGVVSAEPVMRPFDQSRSGFVFGEGAGVVLLESEAHALRRSARAHARLSGWAWGADGHSAVAFNSNGQRIADVIGKALQRARLTPEAIGHVNAHGTATCLNDWIETQALRKAFGPHVDRLMISATKGSTGHLLGAAGSVEFIFSVLALKHQYIPPTAHLDHTDPECALDYTPRTGHAADFQHALSLSFGFGGPIGVLVASRESPR